MKIVKFLLRVPTKKFFTFGDEQFSLLKDSKEISAERCSGVESTQWRIAC